MLVPSDAALVRIFLGEDDRSGGRPLYEAIVLAAREKGLAGATVLRGPMSFGHSSHIHTAKVLQLSKDLPMIVEMVDAEDKLRTFLDGIETMLGSCLVTIEKVQVLRYGTTKPA
ncbi:MAG: DUF190 domain-containing protein [Geminicoccaceae bacterium]